MKTAEERKKDLITAIDLISEISKVRNEEDGNVKWGNSIYAYDDEDLTLLFKKGNFNCERSLVLTGSSDKIATLTSLGAKKIVAFDINPLAEYIWPLKDAFLRSEEPKENYWNYFFFDEKRNTAFSEAYYEKIFKYLDPEYEKFWSSLYDFCGDFAIGNYLSYETSFSTRVLEEGDRLKIQARLEKVLPFLEETNYQNLRRRLQNHEVEVVLHNCDVLQLAPKTAEESFTFGHFSTLPYFLDAELDYAKFLQNNITSHFDQGGKLVIANLYSYTQEDFHSMKKFYDQLSKEEQHLIYHQSTWNKSERQKKEQLLDTYRDCEPQTVFHENFRKSKKGIPNFRIMKNAECLQPTLITLSSSYCDTGICPFDTVLVYTKK